MQPVLKNALLSTHKLKNALVCLGEHSMCFPSYYRPPPSNILREEISFFFQILLWQCQALLSSCLFSRPLDDSSSFLHTSPNLSHAQGNIQRSIDFPADLLKAP